LATPYEYIYFATNTVGTNTISGLTRGVAGTTAHAFFAGAIVAQGLLAEDIVASVPWKFDDQSPTTTVVTIPATGSIPASYLGINYSCIRIEWAARTGSPRTEDLILMQFNGDQGSNYEYQNLSVLSAVATPSLSTPTAGIRVGFAAGGLVTVVTNTGWIEIPFFGTASVRRTAQAQCWRHDSVLGLDINGGNWANVVSAITSVTIFVNAASFIAPTRIVTWLKP
jgi:hypothetical protein